MDLDVRERLLNLIIHELLHSYPHLCVPPTIILRYSPTLLLPQHLLTQSFTPTPTLVDFLPPSSNKVLHPYPSTVLLPATILRHSPSYTPTPTPPSSDTVLHPNSHTTILRYSPTLLLPHHHPPIQSYIPTPTPPYSDTILHPYSDTTILRYSPTHLLRHHHPSI